MSKLEKEMDESFLKQVLVDPEDHHLLTDYKWSIMKYARGNYLARYESKKGNTILLHRQIMGITDYRLFVDHIDHNGLNNQKSNLRVCRNSENACNRRSASNSTSKYLGVSFDKNKAPSKKRWRACITKNKKCFKLGTFETEEEAALAYNAKAAELHGEFANLNII